VFFNYSEFLKESTSKEERLALAEKLLSDTDLKEVLIDCEEGKYPQVQIAITPGAKSYVGVALNDGSSISEVYKTENPRVALLALVMKNTGKQTPEEIASVLTVKDVFLHYAIFAGDKPMSQREVADRYNFLYNIDPSDAIGVFTTTPIKKNY
jgi:hypothetical protein